MIVAASPATSNESRRRGRSMSIGYSSTMRPGRLESRIDPVAEAHRLAHVVGDEDHREAGLAPEPLELVVQHVAGHGVERAERLVHEEDVGLLRERAGERDALAHAAGELVRAACRRSAVRFTRSRSSSALARRSRAWHLADLQRELDVAPRGEPREQRRLLEHQRGAGVAGVDGARARRGRARRSRLSRVLLPQPGRAEQAHELARRDVEA